MIVSSVLLGIDANGHLTAYVKTNANAARLREQLARVHLAHRLVALRPYHDEGDRTQHGGYVVVFDRRTTRQEVITALNNL